MAHWWWGIVAAYALVLFNGFFVATEFAIVKVRRTRLRELEKRGSGAARRALSVVDRQLMVNRADVVTLRLDHTPEERRELARESGHARFPLIDGDIDHIVGIVNVRDLYLSGPSEPRGADELRRFLTPPLYVPESMTAETLLREFRRTALQMAIVVEHGGTAGLVTVGDVVSAVLGELDRPTDERALTPLPDGEFAVDPRMPISEFAAELRVDPEPGDSITVAGLVMEQLGRLPVPGDRVTVGGVELTVEEMDGPRIARLSARRRVAHPGSEKNGAPQNGQ